VVGEEIKNTKLRLEGDKVYLQQFSMENLYDPRYYKWLRDLDVVATIYRMEYMLPMEFSEVEKYVKTLLKSKDDGFFAIYLKENDEFIGTQRVGHIDWRVGTGDIGIVIGNKDYWGRGLAKDSTRTICRYALKSLSLRRLTGGTPATNVAMHKCFESLGFKLEGQLRKQLLLNGEYVDHNLYGLFPEDFDK
jgi:RimJ/RimL family protein N-acetyltransferase